MRTFDPESIDGKRLAIVAGHYCVAEELADLSAAAPAEESSFALGVALFASARRRGRVASLNLWVNDIGADPATRERLKSAYRLPDNYRRLLHSFEVAPEHVRVLFESSTRNKASTRVKQLSARQPERLRRVRSDSAGLVRCIEACSIEDESKHAWVIDGPDGAPLVVKDGPHPKCNMILGTLFQDVVRAIAADRVVTVFNSIYVNRIGLGMFVARELLEVQTEFSNLYTFEDASCRLGVDGPRHGVFEQRLGEAA
jgi:hypothetical protein